jgi:hypothetical protein
MKATAGLVAGAAQHRRHGPVGGDGRRAAPQQHGVARLEAEPGGVAGDIGPVLVDHPDDAEGHSHLADLEPVGPDPSTDRLAYRVGEAGHLPQTRGHRRYPPPCQAQAVDDAGGGPGLGGARHIHAVGGEDVGGVLLEQVGGQQQRRVFDLGGGGRDQGRGGDDPSRQQVERGGGHRPSLRGGRLLATAKS